MGLARGIFMIDSSVSGGGSSEQDKGGARLIGRQIAQGFYRQRIHRSAAPVSRTISPLLIVRTRSASAAIS